jgi:hypothetical protein
MTAHLSNTTPKEIAIMKHSQSAAQLSTVRDDLLNASAFADTIKRLSAIGYPAVELIPSETVSDKEIAKICEQAGVKIASAHVLDNCSLKDQEIVAKMQASSTHGRSSAATGKPHDRRVEQAQHGALHPRIPPHRLCVGAPTPKLKEKSV